MFRNMTRLSCVKNNKKDSIKLSYNITIMTIRRRHNVSDIQEPDLKTVHTIHANDRGIGLRWPVLIPLSFSTSLEVAIMFF